MIDRATRLRWRRRFRRRQHQVEDLGVQAEEQIERHFFTRLNRLAGVRRFVAAWLLLVVFLIAGVVYQARALSGYYKELTPVAGGTFTEGIIGSFSNANPLYATGAVDGSVSRLLFASLLRYDANNQLVSDLAASWSVDTTEHVYTVTLRPNLYWQDGRPITAKDVVYTYTTIQNPDAQSPLLSSWQGITVQAKDDKTVTFTLPSVLSSFPHSLTNGIVPEHLLGQIPAAQLRASQFNTVSPVGSGPFKWGAVELSPSEGNKEGKVGLVANDGYYAGRPALDKYTISFFTEERRMLDSFAHHELTAMSGLDDLPDTFQKDAAVTQLSIPINAEIMVFFRTSQEILTDVKVRQALVEAVDQNDLVDNLGFPAIAVREPLLKGHVGYDPAISQLPFDRSKAAALLQEAGWMVGKDGIREKDGKQLKFSLYSQSTSEYAAVTQHLQRDWQQVGVQADVFLQPDSELKTTVAHHSYDALLYGISLGADSDAYAYWGSTQADERAANRVNFSEYKSTTADSALEAGRTRADPALRAVKYKPFLEAWRSDAPALALYQPRYLFVTRDALFGFDPPALNTPVDRYNNVSQWMIHQQKVNKLR